MPTTESSAWTTSTRDMAQSQSRGAFHLGSGSQRIVFGVDRGEPVVRGTKFLVGQGAVLLQPSRG